MYAARLWWLLRYAGHDAVTVLDGGWNAWCAENGPVIKERRHRAAATFVPRFRPELLAGVDDVGAASAGGRIRLIDARSPERFRGEGEMLDPVGGHIPGARNAFYQKNLDDRGRWRDGDDLRASYEDVARRPVAIGDDRLLRLGGHAPVTTCSPSSAPGFQARGCTSARGASGRAIRPGRAPPATNPEGTAPPLSSAGPARDSPARN